MPSTGGLCFSSWCSQRSGNLPGHRWKINLLTGCATVIKHFCKLTGLSHHWRNRADSCLQNCVISVTLAVIGVWTSCLRSCHKKYSEVDLFHITVLLQNPNVPELDVTNWWFLLVGRGLEIFPWMWFLPSLNWDKRGLQFFRCCSGCFMTFWMSRYCALWVILVGRPFLGRFKFFLYLCIMVVTVVQWSPKNHHTKIDLFALSL